MNEKMIAALLRERAGYRSAGKDDRVKLVDEQLKLMGYKSTDQEVRQVAPQGRTAVNPQQQTANPQSVEKKA